MKNILLITAAASILLCAGCADKAEKEAKPTFLFWCFRKEIQQQNYHVPELKTPAQAAYIQGRLKSIPGYVDSSWNLENGLFTVSYKSSEVRTMNFEEAIALSGFAANNRPANPKAKIPDGVK
ncbi:hypothetical protein [Pontiella sulfatireligans]|uniref:HMA domain-containing protein n=1 Tax=Pontiella sulfatireligans TaxID=2750658 RepID=A0A6C2URV3_9BACT|nr:hypothetical protein [Pontiella sulfatireligans]VGO23070.1 hypothetical protein SCARR_05169 [Pontiella sulfatireligans]